MNQLTERVRGICRAHGGPEEVLDGPPGHAGSTLACEVGGECEAHVRARGDRGDPRADQALAKGVELDQMELPGL